ncbi:MAG: DUF2938 domain-containing protein [Chromatiales bacterium]|nr:DUF2938 domain-containing protein [Chromatiales bacterium]
MMEFILPLYLAGLVGSLGMDLISPLAERLGYRTGVTMPLIGRWFIGLFSGRFFHADIRHTPVQQHENLVGWLFHYFIGGGAVALLFLPILWAGDYAVLPSSPLPWVAFGLFTSFLPWLLLMPSYGWGLFGMLGPNGSKPLIASPLNHLGYGVGLWAGINLLSVF